MTTIDTAAIRKMTDDMYPNIEELYVTLDKCADEIDRLRAELAAKNALLEKAERLLDGAVLAKLKEQE